MKTKVRFVKPYNDILKFGKIPIDLDTDLTLGNLYDVVEIDNNEDAHVIDDAGDHNLLVEGQYEIVEEESEEEKFNPENRKIIDIYKSETISFMEYEKDKYVLRVEPNGDIYYKGKLLETEAEVAEGLLRLSKFIQGEYKW